MEAEFSQWLFLVPVKGGRWHIIPQLAVYTTYTLPSGGFYATYHLLREPETAIDFPVNKKNLATDKIEKRNCQHRLMNANLSCWSPAIFRKFRDHLTGLKKLDALKKLDISRDC